MAHVHGCSGLAGFGELYRRSPYAGSSLPTAEATANTQLAAAEVLDQSPIRTSTASLRAATRHHLRDQSKDIKMSKGPLTENDNENISTPKIPTEKTQRRMHFIEEKHLKPPMFLTYSDEEKARRTAKFDAEAAAKSA